MSANLPSFYVQQYATNIKLLLQQMESRLRGAVTSGSHVGAQASPVDQIGAISALKVTSRFSPMGRVDAPLSRRWVSPNDYELPQMIDSFDMLRLITDPKSSYVQNAGAAMNRAMDMEIINAYFGNASTGTTGTAVTSFDSTNQVVSVKQGSTSSSGLTVAKLRQAKKILMQNEVDLDTDPLYCVITAKQADNLLAEAQVISADYNSKPALVDGKIMSFMGFNFIHSELLSQGTDDQSGTSYAIPAYAKSGMYLGLWNEINTDVSQRKDITSLPWQVYAKGSFGATRLEEKKVVKIWCA